MVRLQIVIKSIVVIILNSYCLSQKRFANVQVTHPQRLKTSLIQMIIMPHKCVAQQVVTYESLKTKEKTSWQFPKVVAVAYESFQFHSLNDNSNRVSRCWSLTRAVARRALTVSYCSQCDSSCYLVWWHSSLLLALRSPSPWLTCIPATLVLFQVHRSIPVW